MPFSVRRSSVIARGIAAIVFLVLSLSRVARAHPGTAFEPHNIASAWTLDWWILLLVFVPVVIYFNGTSRVWRSAGVGRGVRYTHVAAFAAATLTMVIALISPLDALGSALFSAHMTQHQLLMVVAPPLYLFSAPAVAVLWSVPSPHTRLFANSVRYASRSPLWRVLSHPAVAWSLHATAIWLWHVPALYERTLFSDSMHGIQHFCFTASAMLFWFTVMHPKGRADRGRGAAILSVFTTAVHTSALAALLTFSASPWYLAYARSTTAWGLSLLEDQQLGGLIMWVPGGIIYTVAALFATMVWLRKIEARTRSGGLSDAKAQVRV